MADLTTLTLAELIAVTNDRGDAMVASPIDEHHDVLDYTTARFVEATNEQLRRLGLSVEDQASIDRIRENTLAAIREEENR